MRQLATMLSVESLSQLGDDGRPVPKLAESWWWENDGLRLNINLRPGIQFHDGTPLTAAVAAKILGDAVSTAFEPRVVHFLQLMSNRFAHRETSK